MMLPILRRLLAKKTTPVSSSTMSCNFDISRHGFDELLEKINSYFSGVNEKDRSQFEKELYFINNQVADSNRTSEEKILYSIIPYSFTQKYDYTQVPVFRDEEAGMFYVFQDRKRLYYHRGFRTVVDVQRSFTYLSVEQNDASPHCYMVNDFSLNDGETVVDCGAAEGNFSLMIVDKVSKLFIIEADVVWVEALQKTFEPWKHKVHIINKYVGGSASENTITLAAIMHEFQPSFIKMDIEGSEVSALEEAKLMLWQPNLRWVITTYHRKHDADNIKNLLEAAGYSTFFSDGYMLFVYDTLTPPYFRRGLIRAVGTGRE